MHTKSPHQKEAPPQIVAPTELLLKPVVKVERLKILPGTVININMLKPPRASDDTSTIPAEEPGSQFESASNTSDKTEIYSLPDTPVLLVTDLSDKYKKPKYKLPPTLKSKVKSVKPKFQVQIHGIVKCHPKYWFKCVAPKCKRSFPTIKYWNDHHQEEHPTVALQCNICHWQFNTVSAQRAHRNYHASHKHRCIQCGKTFAYISALRQHVFVHATTTKHKCFAGGCTQSYKWPQDLNRHIKTHIQGRIHSCRDCGKSFLEQCLLHKHAAKHSKSFQFVCPKCGSKMKWETSYKRHVSKCSK